MKRDLQSLAGTPARALELQKRVHLPCGIIRGTAQSVNLQFITSRAMKLVWSIAAGGVFHFDTISIIRVIPHGLDELVRFFSLTEI